MQNFNTLSIFGFVNNGKTEFCKYLGLSKHLDAFKEEKSRKMTIQIGQTYLTDGRCNYLVLDLPGHAVLTSKVIVGLTLTNIPIFIISCLEEDGGIVRIPFFVALLSKLKIKKIIVVVTKTDLREGSEVDTFIDTIKTQLGGLQTVFIRYNMFMDKQVFLPTFFSSLQTFSKTENTFLATENLVIRSFNPNLPNSQPSTLTGAVLGVWGNTNLVQGAEFYLAPFKVEKKWINLKLTALVVRPQYAKIAKTIQTNLAFYLAANNRLINTVVLDKPSPLTNKLTIFPQVKTYQRNEQVILVLANFEIFAKIIRINSKPYSLILEFEYPLPTILMNYPLHICKRVGYAWTLTDAYVTSAL